MNLPTALAKTFVLQPFQAILEILPNGQVAAWVPEFPDSKIVAVDRTTAISELEKVLKKRLESIERVAIAVDAPAENTQSIDDFPMIPANDEYFRELMATLRADRELDNDNPAYTVNW